MDSENIVNSVAKARPLESKCLPNTLAYCGHGYTIKERLFMSQGKGETGYYNCTYFRGEKCKATLTIKCYSANLSEPKYVLKNEHICIVNSVNGDAPEDVFTAMSDLAEQRALENPSMKAKSIAQSVLDDIKVQYEGKPICNLMKIEQLVNKVYNTRHREFENWEQQLCSYPLSMCGPQLDQPFLQFVRKFVNVCKELETVIGWGHPGLLFLLRNSPVPLFVDMTFKMVPKQFAQLMIIMFHCSATNQYIQVLYVLLESKTELAYFVAVECVIGATNWKIDASSLTCDFEQALINTLTKQFPEAETIFVYFTGNKQFVGNFWGISDFRRKLFRG